MAQLMQPGSMNPIFQQPFGANQGNFFTGRPAQLNSINKYSPEAQSALSQLTGSASQGFNNPYAGFEPIAQRARSQFHGSTVPGIAERFASMGSNALSSPALYSQLGAAGAGLEEGLAALQSQYGMQNRGRLLQELLAGISPQNEYFYQPREAGFAESFLSPLLGSASQMGGGNLISALLSLLSNRGQ
jgi:hypothetical protein